MTLWLVSLMGFMAVWLAVCALMPKSATAQAPQLSERQGVSLWTRLTDALARRRHRPMAQQPDADLALLRPRFHGTRHAPQGIMRRLLSLLGRVPPMSEALAEHLGDRLSYLGSGLSAREFNGLKLMLPVLLTGGMTLMAPLVVRGYPILLVLALIVGFFIPDVWLHGRIGARHKAIVRLLPEVVDLLGLCMGAGLDFLGALNRVVAAKAPGPQKEPLLEELSLVIQEIKFGKRRGDALKAMGARVGLPELSSFVRTLVQADRMGTPIAEVLSAHSEDVRFERYNRAERAALKAPIKILVPLIFCILPCVAIIVAAPVFIQFSRMKPFGQ